MTDPVPAALYADGERGAGGVIPPNATLVGATQPRPAALVYTHPPLIDPTAGCRCSTWSCWASTEHADNKREAAVTAEFLQVLLKNLAAPKLVVVSKLVVVVGGTLSAFAAATKHCEQKADRLAQKSTDVVAPGSQRGCPAVHTATLSAPLHTQSGLSSLFNGGGPTIWQ